MTRNGDMFGGRVGGLGDRWFTAPVNTRHRGYFYRFFAGDQANPDMGDAPLLKAFGIGGAAMIAARRNAVFVGAGEWKRRNLFSERDG